MSEDRTRSVAPRARVADPSTRLRLIVFCGGAVSSHPLPRRGEVVLGRGDDAGVKIDHATVSRKHATLTLDDEIFITDHGSFNGTTIGGKKLTPNVRVPIELATICELGETMAIVQVEGGENVTASRSGVASTPRPELSPAMQHLYRLVEQVAQSTITVIVRGETGVGKELVAEELHKRSSRAAAPLVKINCAAMPEQLLESELFGYERGAFTGATQAKPGLVESAHGGTLFLDEIGEMPLPTQAKLLRVVESREVMRIGALRPKSVDVRIVGATHRSLEDMVADGHFRQDLYYRLNGVSLFVPPLRERAMELPRLANELLARFCKESKRPLIPISDAAMSVLKAYPWPGNVRELKNVIERAVLFCKTIAIAPEHLGLGERTSRPPPRASDLAFAVAATHLAPPARAPAPALAATSLPAEVDALERERIMNALAECGGNQTQAAEMLGISRRTLLRRLDEYSVKRPRKG